MVSLLVFRYDVYFFTVWTIIDKKRNLKSQGVLGVFRGCTGKHKQTVLRDFATKDFKIFTVLEFTIKVSLEFPCSP